MVAFIKLLQHKTPSSLNHSRVCYRELLGWTSMPWRGYPPLGVDVHARDIFVVVMSMPRHGYPYRGMDLYSGGWTFTPGGGYVHRGHIIFFNNLLTTNTKNPNPFVDTAKATARF